MIGGHRLWVESIEAVGCRFVCMSQTYSIQIVGGDLS